MRKGVVVFSLVSLLASLPPIRAFLLPSYPSSRLIITPHPSQLHQSPLPSPDDSQKKPQPISDSFSQSRCGDGVLSRSSQTISSRTSAVPSYKSIILFVFTTILIWLSEPLLSLVDTTFVGRQGALTQLAALSPATMLNDSLLYLTYFLSIATTSKVATSLAKKNYKAMISSCSQIMGVAGILGGLITAIIFALGRPLLKWCAGDSGTTSLIAAALSYSKIRCSISMLSIMGMVAQSICLAVQDTKTPALAVAVASITNIVGDYLLIPIYGLKGAAVATAAASACSALVLLSSVRRKTAKWKKLADESNANGSDFTGSTKINGGHVNGSNSTREDAVVTMVVDGKPSLNITRTIPVTSAVDANTTGDTIVSDSSTGSRDVSLLPSTPTAIRDTKKSRVALLPFLSKRQKNASSSNIKSYDSHVRFVSFPDGISTVELMRLAGPIFFVIVAKVVCYASLTLKATNFGVVQLATHNIMMRVFFMLATLGYSLTQAAQTYLPAATLQESNDNVKRLLKKLIVLANGIGMFNFIATRFVLLQMGQLFTTNKEIIKSMAGHTTSISIAALLHGYIMIFEGAIIAQGDLKYLVATYVLTMAVLFAQLKYATPHFGGVWIALLLFQVLRLTQFKFRVIQKVLLTSPSSKKTSES